MSSTPTNQPELFLMIMYISLAFASRKAVSSSTVKLAANSDLSVPATFWECAWNVRGMCVECAFSSTVFSRYFHGIFTVFSRYFHGIFHCIFHCIFHGIFHTFSEYATLRYATLRYATLRYVTCCRCGVVWCVAAIPLTVCCAPCLYVAMGAACVSSFFLLSAAVKHTRTHAHHVMGTMKGMCGER